MTLSNQPIQWRCVPVLLVVLALSGCLTGAGARGATSDSPGDTATTDARTTVDDAEQVGSPLLDPDVLDSALRGFLAADNRTAYADRHGLTFEGGRVQVVVELRPRTSVPTEYDIVTELHSDDEVLARVSASGLADLSRHENVTAIRIPERPEPQGDRSSVALQETPDSIQ